MLHSLEQEWSIEAPLQENTAQEAFLKSLEEKLNQQEASLKKIKTIQKNQDLFKKKLGNKNFLTALPTEMFHAITGYLGPRNIVDLSAASKKLRLLTQGTITKLNFDDKPIEIINQALERYAGPQVKSLLIENTDLSDLNWQLVQRCNNLEKLTLLEAELTQLPQILPSLTHLKYLLVEVTPEEEEPINWNLLPNTLEGLSLPDCHLTELPQRLQNLPQLKYLFLHRNNLSAAQNWDALPVTLNELSLGTCSLEELPPRLSALTHLTELDLNYNQIDDEAQWDRLPISLEKLYLGKNGFLDIPAQFNRLVNLTVLDLHNNDLDDDSNWTILSQLPKLTEVDLTNNYNLTVAPPALVNAGITVRR
jgi:Leucine-rich repeat (LRR) protein